MQARSEPALSAYRHARARSTSIAWIARLAGLAVVYVVTGKVSLAFASLHQSASPVWLPSGIALAAVILRGPRLWPAIFVGAFLVNASTVDSPLASLGIAAGNTAEALIGGWLVTRFARGSHAFESASTVLRFVLLGGLVAPIASATLGVASLGLGGLAEWGRFGPIWLTWWIGDMVGVVLIAPILVIWSEVRLRHRHDLAMLGETAAAVVVTALVAVLVFDLNTSLLLVQLFTATITVMNLVLVALVRERSRASVALRRNERELTSQLHEIEDLEHEARAHSRVEAEVAAAVESERLRLGTELHEGLGQELAGIAYLMAALHQTLRRAASEQASEAMRLEDMITRSIERTRVLAKAFYPVEMETLGLVGSLEEMAYNAMRSFDIRCRVRADLETGASDLRGSMAIQLFRIAEEAIYYEVKQGHARSIEIAVAVDDGKFVLTISGDGVGVSSDVEDAQSAGLRRMRYRAGIIGGQLDVRSQSSGGTSVRCSAPLLASRPLVAH